MIGVQYSPHLPAPLPPPFRHTFTYVYILKNIYISYSYIKVGWRKHRVSLKRVKIDVIFACIHARARNLTERGTNGGTFMGEAKRKKSGPQIVFHHTSILRTNLIWMSGKIELEGQGRPAFHPHMGKHISQSVEARRPCREFPPLAWFTSRIDVPHCLRKITFCGENQETGEVTNIVLSDREASAISLRRMALGFRVEDIGVIRWTDHYGYCTAEGRDLNESAIEYGDNPEDWWVSETPVDVALVHEAWVATSSWGVKMQRMPGYEKDIRRMVALCKERRTYIPPAWLSRDDAQALAQSIGLPCVDADEEADRFLQSH